MTMDEWWAEYEAYLDSSSEGHAGNLKGSDVDAILDDLELTDDEWWDKHGRSSSGKGNGRG